MPIDCLVNGHPSDAVPCDDRGLLYGDGLFETLRVREGVVPLWTWHWRRLVEGCRRLGLDAPNENQLLAEIRQLSPSGDQVVRLTLTRGSGRGYAPASQASVRRIIQALGAAPGSPTQDLVVGICTTRLGRNPTLAGLKHLARLEQVLAAAEVQRAGWDEGLVLGEDGEIIEATMSNLFGLRDDRLVTPDLAESGVAGVYRQWLIDHEPVDVIRLRREDLATCDGVFLCNAVRGVMPVARVVGLADWTSDALQQWLIRRDWP